MSDQLSVHRVGKFYSFKRMIGGARFYFGREFGITNEGHSNRQNNEAALNREPWLISWNRGR